MGLLVLLGGLVAVAPQQPAMANDLAAAASARQSLRYDRALVWYAAAAQADPYAAQPHCEAGDVLALQQQWHAAVTEIRACLARNPSDGAAYLALGSALLGGGDTTGARAAWEYAASRLGQSDGTRQIALLDERTGNLADAQAQWAKLGTNDADALAHLGIFALSEGDIGTARNDFDGAERALRDRGGVRLAETFGRFVSQPPVTADALGKLGYTLLSANLSYLALRPLNVAVSLEPSNGTVRAFRGWAEHLTGNSAAASADEALATTDAPTLPFAWFAAGEVALSHGDVHGAVAAFQGGLAAQPENAELWQALGRVEHFAHDDVEAQQSFTQAVRYGTDPSYVETQLQAYLDSGAGITTQMASVIASTAEQRWPRVSSVRFLAAEVYGMLGQTDAANDALRAAETLDPLNPGPHVLLGEIFLNERAYLSAAAEFRTALALAPNGLFASRARADLAPLATLQV